MDRSNQPDHSQLTDEVDNKAAEVEGRDASRRRVMRAGGLGLCASALTGSTVLRRADALAQTAPAAPAKAGSSSGSEVTYQSGDARIKAFLARPAGAVQPNGAAIIVIHEIWGLNDHIRDVARRF